MKFTQEDYNGLALALQENVVSFKRPKGVSDTRYLWDLLWESKWNEAHRDTMDKYHDSHIQTALKNIVSDIRFCFECGRFMSEDEHNYGTNETAGNLQVCIQCFNDAQLASQ